MIIVYIILLQIIGKEDFMDAKKQTTKKVVKQKSDLRHIIVFDHARVDPSHCLTDGLFRPLKRESLKGKGLDVSYIYKDYTLRWVNYKILGIADQSVFLAVHRLASEKGRFERVGISHENLIMLDVRKALKLDLDAENLDCLVLETSLYEIAKTIGIADSGTNLKRIRESLINLSFVSFVIYRGNETTQPFWKANLFSTLAGVDGRIVVGINPMLCKALVGEQCTYICMSEQRSLKSDVAKRLHVWISSWARHGVNTKIGLDTLIPHVWGDVVQGEALYTRRNTLRKSIAELDSLDGWTCKEDKASGMVSITRPKLGKEVLNN